MLIFLARTRCVFFLLSHPFPRIQLLERLAIIFRLEGLVEVVNYLLVDRSIFVSLCLVRSLDLLDYFVALREHDSQSFRPVFAVAQRLSGYLLLFVVEDEVEQPQ